MRVSVVVPAYNEEAGLEASLRSIRSAMVAWERREWNTELIVCDNNSTDRTAEIAQACDAIVVFEPLNQISRARNAGAAHATGDWLVFVDADSHPSRALLETVAEEMSRGVCLAGGSTVTFDQADRSVRLVAGAWNLCSRLTRWAAGSFVFCEASAFRAVGGFSEALYAGEEIDLFRKLRRMARATRRSIVILHCHPLTTSGRKAKLYSWNKMLGFFVRTVIGAGRTLRSAEACFAWYDGRR